MQLPKNITQIGEIDRDCKVYVEDYVVSYIKQLNAVAEDKDMAVSLYGRHEEENGIVYCFVYGACKLDFLQKEVRHLSQAQNQEIEKWRRKYFPELDFLGYRILNGEMIEGFHICEQDICRYISGFAQFYEKNDAMLAYMLDVREEVKPEQVDRQKYDEVKQRQEERRSGAEISSIRDMGDNIVPISSKLQKMRLASVGVFALLCLFGIAAFRERVDIDGAGYASTAVDGQAVASGNGQADAVVGGQVSQADQDPEVLVMEDKLEKALRGENKSGETAESVAAGDTKAAEESKETAESVAGDGTKAAEGSKETAESVAAGDTKAAEGLKETAESVTGEDTKAAGESKETAESVAAGGTEAAEGSKETAESVTGDDTKAAEESKETAGSRAAAAIQSTTYKIQPGDTLLAISKRKYGTTAKVSDICKINKISNPDDIKEGQVITLP